MTWPDGPLFAFDTETTGVDPMEARIVTATAFVLDPAGQHTTEWLADPGVEIPAGASEIHGITTEHARAHGRPAAEVAGQLCLALYEGWDLGGPVIAYNAAYDLTVLDNEMQRHFGERLEIRGPVVDPFVLDKQMDRYRKGKRTLTACCDHYRVNLGDQGAHNATADTIGAARLAWRIAQVYPEIGRADLAELHQLQIGWYAEQADGLAKYFARQGKTEAVSREWPLRTVTLAQATAGQGPGHQTSLAGGVPQETTT
jgi:DNA polymerase-3 subunit epsilon